MEHVSESSLTALHQVNYPDFTDDEFSVFIEECRLRHINPSGRHVYAKRQWSDVSGKNEVVILLTVDGFRAVAAETAEYRGWVGPFFSGETQSDWSDVWRGEGFPFAARFGVLRDGFKDYAYRIATWDEFAQFSDKGELLDHWHRMPCHMLGLRAEAAALRSAFPERLAGVYMTGELDRPPGHPRRAESGKIAPKIATDDDLTTALADLGYETDVEQGALIQAARRRFPLLAANNPAALNAKIIAETKPKRVIVPV